MIKKRILILSPHPDDECLMGLLPLRLQEECGFEVDVWPVTFGSLPGRRAARKKELKAACGILGFHVVGGAAAGGDISCQLGALTRWIERNRPLAVFLPHALDGHATHQLVHRLGLAVVDACGLCQAVFETEYWHPMRHPNVMVSATAGQVEHLQQALSAHQGEMMRNDYAARLPAWMIDNIRRGTELLGGAGAAAPDMPYAVLYRARIRQAGKWKRLVAQGTIIDSSADVGDLAARLVPTGPVDG